MSITLVLSFHPMKLIFVFVSKDGIIQQAAGFILGEDVKAALGHAGGTKLVFSYYV